MTITNTQLTDGTIIMKINDKEYNAGVLDDLDSVELDAWVQKEIIELGRNQYWSIDDSNERKEILQAAIQCAVGIAWNSTEGAKVIQSKIGMCRLGWQMVKERYPKMTFEKFMKEVLVKGNKEKSGLNLSEIQRVFRELNVPKDDDDSSPESAGEKK